jgi:steroid delta-isomerase-like uncharacterized protein
MRAAAGAAILAAMTNKDVITRFVDEFQTGHDWAAFDELLHPDVVDHGRDPDVPAGREGVRLLFEGMLAAFPDLRAEILDQAAEGDKVWTHKVFRATHEGEFSGIPATGREVEFRVIDIVRIRDGQIVEHWNVLDRLTLLQQLGAVPAPA